MEKTESSSVHAPAPWHVDYASQYSRICIKPWPGQVICDLCPLKHVWDKLREQPQETETE